VPNTVYVEVVNEASGKVLGDPGFSTSNGTGIIQWQWNGGHNEEWVFNAAGNGTTQIVNAFSGLSLGDPGFSTSNGTQMIQWGYTGAANMQWKLLAAGNGPGFPPYLFAPYVDETSDSSTVLNVNTLASDVNTKYLSLGFIDSDSQGNPVWGTSGNAFTDTDYSVTLKNSIAALQARGGNVILSFGGESDSSVPEVELARQITNLNTLEQTYLKVINFYNVTHIDFDIEGDNLPDGFSAAATAMSNRSQAMAWLQQQIPGLTISLTLEAGNGGFGSQEQQLITSAVQAGVHLSFVNIMDMYLAGTTNATNAENEAAADEAQLKSLLGLATDAQAYAMLGITTLDASSDGNGSNGLSASDTTQLINWAYSKGVGEMSSWYDYTLSNEEAYTSLFESQYTG
jgi:hypothetical protein